MNDVRSGADDPLGAAGRRTRLALAKEAAAAAVKEAKFFGRRRWRTIGWRATREDILHRRVSARAPKHAHTHFHLTWPQSRGARRVDLSARSLACSWWRRRRPHARFSQKANTTFGSDRDRLCWPLPSGGGGDATTLAANSCCCCCCCAPKCLPLPPAAGRAAHAAATTN